MGITGSASAHVAAPPDEVFARITDIGRLPEWNEIMTRVIERPDALVPGSQWVVEFHAMGGTWRSRSTLQEIDPASRRFAYRSQTDDGNPSFAVWSWEVAEENGGSRVQLSWDVNPKTFWRRVLLARIRSRQLRKEVPESLAALAGAAVRG